LSNSEYEDEEEEGSKEDYAPEKTLTFYELDLGLNHVVRKYVFRGPVFFFAF
jgi:hypothetical protein